MSRKMPRKGDIYRHFKGKKYRIIDLAVCTETGEDMVIFESADENRRVYASFLESFLSALDTGKYPHADQKYRFELCRDEKGPSGSALKRHGSTTSLILEFLDLEDNDQRIRFLQKHRARIDSRFFAAAGCRTAPPSSLPCRSPLGCREICRVSYARQRRFKLGGNQT